MIRLKNYDKRRSSEITNNEHNRRTICADYALYCLYLYYIFKTILYVNISMRVHENVVYNL